MRRLSRALQPHVSGLIYVGLLTLVGLAAMNNQNNLLFWVFGVMAAALVISAIVSTLIMWSIAIKRLDPQHGVVGQPLVIRYALTNRSRLMSAFNLVIEEERSASSEGWSRRLNAAQAWVMHVGPRETVHGEAIFWPLARGPAAFSAMRVSTTFPFGIVCSVRLVKQPQHTLIHPRVFELKRSVLRSVMPAGLLGAKIAMHAGPGDDYYGMREYRLGDHPRQIAWKRLAMTDELITIERTSPSPSKLRVVLDLSQPTEALHTEPLGRDAARELEEQAISLAASIIHAAEREGYETGLTILGTPAEPIAIRRSQWHRNKMMAALAAIDLDQPRLKRNPQPVRDAERAALIVVAPDRVQPLPGRDAALYLTARQLPSLIVNERDLGPQHMSATGGAVNPVRVAPQPRAEAAA